MVRINYARMIDNPVLSDPVGVKRVVGNQIFLKDGRVIELDGAPLHSAWDELKKNGGEIEIDSSDGDGFVTLWGKKRRSVCGGTAVIRIPLIPHDVNRNERRLVGCGSFVEAEPRDEAEDHPDF